MDKCPDSREYELFCVIVNHGVGSKIIKFSKQHGISGATVILGKGTIKNHWLEALELFEIRREIVFVVAEKELGYSVMNEIEKKFDEIVAFSEIEKFIDTPVKRYSSGMYMRLAFAVSAHLEPEILVVDEVLAVGDAEFQRKCLGKMSDVASEGRTVIFVSHNMSAIQRLTQECIILDQGRMVLRARTPEAVDYYLTNDFSASGERRYAPSDVPSSAYPFKPLAVRVRNRAGVITDSMLSVEPITIEVEYELDSDITGLRVGIYLMTSRGEYIFTSFDTDDPEKFQSLSVRKAGHYVSRCTIPADTFNEGRFVIGINASSYMVKRYFSDERAINFSVNATGAPGMHWVEVRHGPLRPRLDWRIEEAP